LTWDVLLHGRRTLFEVFTVWRSHHFLVLVLIRFLYSVRLGLVWAGAATRTSRVVAWCAGWLGRPTTTFQLTSRFHRIISSRFLLLNLRWNHILLTNIRRLQNILNPTSQTPPIPYLIHFHSRLPSLSLVQYTLKTILYILSLLLWTTTPLTLIPYFFFQLFFLLLFLFSLLFHYIILHLF
jgi:hypothetical protein